jgi:hypothetical protein
MRDERRKRPEEGSRVRVEGEMIRLETDGGEKT